MRINYYGTTHTMCCNLKWVNCNEEEDGSATI